MTNRLLLLLGYVLQKWGFIPVFVSTLCVDCILFLYIYFYLAKVNLPEKRTNESTIPLIDNDSDHEQHNEAVAKSGSVAVPSTSAYISHMVQLFRTVTSSGKLTSMMLVFMLLYFGIQGELLVQTLFLKNDPYTFSAQQIGYYGAVQAASRTLGTVIITQVSE